MAEKRGFFGSIKDGLVRGGVFGASAQVDLLRADYDRSDDKLDTAGLLTAIHKIKALDKRCRLFSEIDIPDSSEQLFIIAHEKESETAQAIYGLSRMNNDNAPTAISKIIKERPNFLNAGLSALKTIANRADSGMHSAFTHLQLLLTSGQLDSDRQDEIVQVFEKNIAKSEVYKKLASIGRPETYAKPLDIAQVLVTHLNSARTHDLNGFISLLPDHKGALLTMLREKNTDAAMQIVAQSYLRDERYSAAAMDVLVQNGGTVAMGLAKDHLVGSPKDMIERAQSLSGVNVSKPEPKARVEALISSVALEISQGASSARLGDVSPLMDRFGSIAQQKGLNPAVMQGFNAAALTYMREWNAKGQPPAPAQP